MRRRTNPVRRARGGEVHVIRYDLDESSSTERAIAPLRIGYGTSRARRTVLRRANVRRLDETARRDEASEAAGEVGMNVPQPAPSPEEPIVDLVPIVRRVVAARISDPATRRRHRAGDPGPGHGGAVAGRARDARPVRDRHRAQPDRVAGAARAAGPAQRPPARRAGRARSRARRTRRLRQEEAALVDAALARLPPPDREILLAHEVEGTDTADARRRAAAPRRARSPRS